MTNKNRQQRRAEQRTTEAQQVQEVQQPQEQQINININHDAVYEAMAQEIAQLKKTNIILAAQVDALAKMVIEKQGQE